MSPLRARFIQFLQLRGFTQATIDNYVQGVKQFQDWFGRSPIRMTKDTVRDYLCYLRNDKKLAPRTINIHFYALKGFCEFFLPRSGIMEPFRRMRTPEYQPVVLSRTEVDTFIAAAPSLKARAILTTLYSAGLRLNECLTLRLTDVDSKRMVLHINGKGARQRYALLSAKTLELLRSYYRQYRPTNYLFPGRTPGSHYSHKGASLMVRATARRAGLSQHVTAHTLRHSFATHLLERGESLLVIQRLLGHATITTTTMYTKVSTEMLQAVKSPLDQPPPVPQAAEATSPAKPKRRKKAARTSRKKTSRKSRTRRAKGRNA
jgi:integrase/recombinase XerD